MSLSWLRWLGRISYGVYVYHWPLFLWFDDNLVRIGTTLLAAYVSYRFLEEPIRSRRIMVGAAGFGGVRYRAMTGGIAVLHGAWRV